MTPTQEIQFLNISTGNISDESIQAYVAAQGKQLARDFAPVWGRCPALRFSSGAFVATDNATPGYIGGASDVPGALGYHDEGSDGLQYLKVFDMQGYDWRTTASHEVLELAADGPANMWANNGQGTQLIAYEVGDPVEGDTYDVDGAPMSNFVLPAWFDPHASAGSQFDFMGKLAAPFTMTPGGYMIVWELTGTPTQVFGARVEPLYPSVYIHFGPAVPDAKVHGILAKYAKTLRRHPRRP
jgi:hypothetical protein